MDRPHGPADSRRGKTTSCASRPEQALIRKLFRIEDHDVTNQFNVFGDVNPGPYRYWLVKSILRVVDYTTRHIYRRGFLARIRTIHFARWAFLNDGCSMYFVRLARFESR